MDRRIVFFAVFVITLISTLLVFAVSIYTQQTLMTTVVYGMVTMWLMGIISQVLLQHLYQSMVRPMEHARMDEEADKAKLEINLEDIEEIDQVAEMEREVGQAAARAVKDRGQVIK